MFALHLGQCEELERSIDGGWIELSDITRIVGSTATVTCYDEYYTGGGSITCGVNGNWSSASTPQCIPGECIIIGKWKRANLVTNWEHCSACETDQCWKIRCVCF